ncbi:hypothetical protein ACOSP7_029725 [Xanthoceras sorbifolium]
MITSLPIICKIHHYFHACDPTQQRPQPTETWTVAISLFYLNKKPKLCTSELEERDFSFGMTSRARSRHKLRDHVSAVCARNVADLGPPLHLVGWDQIDDGGHGQAKAKVILGVTETSIKSIHQSTALILSSPRYGRQWASRIIITSPLGH